MATIEVDDHELRELTRKVAQRAAAEYLTNRTIPPYPAYFFEGNWLVTYDWLQFTRETLQAEIDQLRRQVDWLSRPWYKRWFS